MSGQYVVVIGLEVHVQLLTKSKLFCGCATSFGAPPNSQTCPVCIGMPGTLPVMNRRAVALALKAGIALGCTIAPFTKWDRKNYYYPDLPKNFQISQYDLPVAAGGGLEFEMPGGKKFVRLIRVHLEEDAGKNLHAPAGGDSLVDLNRTGTPLLEIVTEPDLTSPAEARAFLETMRTLMRDLEVSDCEMQEGSLRCDANINLHIPRERSVAKTPIVEIKNLNSIKMVERALRYEASRQYDDWQKTGAVLGIAPKQTRGWDDERQITRPQREKEEASDYRYFPEPDLVPVSIDDAWLDEIRAQLGERSSDRQARYQTELGLSEYDAGVLVEKGPPVWGYFDRLTQLAIEPKTAANWVINDLLRHAVGRVKSLDDWPVAPEGLAALIELVKSKTVNSNDAREKVLPAMVRSGAPAEVIVKQLGLEVVADAAAIERVVDQVIAEMAKAADEVRAGKTRAINALLGAVMGRSKGKFPPDLVRDMLVKKLS